MPKETNLEFKVGMFVMGGLILLTAFIFSVGGSSFLKEGQSVKVVFEFASGLKKNAPVRVAGVDKGIVRKIDLFWDIKDGKIKAEVKLILDEKVKIPIDSVVMINQLGLMGEKYVEILPGINTETFYAENQIIKGKDSIPQEVLAERVMEVAKKLEESIVGFNQIIADEKRIEAIGTTIDNLDRMTKKIDDMLGGLQDGAGTLGKFLKDDKLYSNLQGLIADLNDISSHLKQGQGTVGKFLYDDRIYMDLQELTTDIKEHPWKLLRRPKKK